MFSCISLSSKGKVGFEFVWGESRGQVRRQVGVRDAEVDTQSTRYQSQSGSRCQSRRFVLLGKKKFSAVISSFLSARCDLIQPIKSLSLESERRKHNLLMSLWQARKIAFVQTSEQHPACVTRKTTTESRKRITNDSYRSHARRLLSCHASLSWICVLWERVALSLIFSEIIQQIFRGYVGSLFVGDVYVGRCLVFGRWRT